MSVVKVSLAKKTESSFKGRRLFSFWFTTDHSIDLSSKKCPARKVMLDKLSERSYLELVTAFKLGIIELDKPGILNKHNSEHHPLKFSKSGKY